MPKVKIYEIKSGAIVNVPKLFSPDGRYFYWDTLQFTYNSPGDKIFIVNPTNKWALYTEIMRMDIATVHNPETKTSTFNHEYNRYTVEDEDGRYKVFIQFRIIQKVTIPNDWSWQTFLGSSQIFDLWREDTQLKDIPKRKEKINDLLMLFTEGEAFEVLQATYELLNGPSFLDQSILNALAEESKKSTFQDPEFHFSKAQEKLADLEKFEEPVGGFFSKLLADFNASGQTYTVFKSALDKGSDEFRLFTLIGQLVSYCDEKAANKNEFNTYEDKRVLALSLYP